MVWIAVVFVARQLSSLQKGGLGGPACLKDGMTQASCSAQGGMDRSGMQASSMACVAQMDIEDVL